MRKTTSILLTILTFSLAIATGYFLASLTADKSGPTSQSSGTTETPPAKQNNLLVIQVDDLALDQPNLKAVWLASYFISANQSVMTFTSLFPSADANISGDYTATFAIKPDGTLSKRFLTAVSSANITWDGYLVIDATGSILVETWLKAQGVPIFTSASSAQTLIENTCGYLKAKGTLTAENTTRFDWEQFDAHFQTDLSLDKLLASWDSLFENTHIVRCELIAE